jgi:hypothetical protein
MSDEAIAELVGELRKASVAVYIAVEQPVADSVSNLMLRAANAITGVPWKLLEAWRTAECAVRDGLPGATVLEQLESRDALLAALTEKLAEAREEK